MLLLLLLLAKFLLLLFLLLADGLEVVLDAVGVDLEVDGLEAFGGQSGGDGGEFLDADADGDGFAGGAAEDALVGGDVAEIAAGVHFSPISLTVPMVRRQISAAVSSSGQWPACPRVTP